MKNIIMLALLSVTITFAESTKENASENTLKETTYVKYLTEAIDSVEKAREEALTALDNMVKKVDLMRGSDLETEDSISTQIVETYAISQIAKNTADVEIAKTKAIAVISKAVNDIDNASKENRKKVKDASLSVIIRAIASVEISKAHASKNIAEATKRVELSKTKPSTTMDHPKETLSIAKNLAAVQIAQSVSDVEVAKSDSIIEMARSSIKNIKLPLSQEEEKKLQNIKAEATAKISSYLSRIEVLKAELTTKIAEEIVKVEIAKNKMLTSHE
ncbi:MAG: hypothetical protein Q9M39_00715 [Sulfurovum sp.]|nr:hypothetical protein [Sulfurovum sp.]